LTYEEPVAAQAVALAAVAEESLGMQTSSEARRTEFLSDKKESTLLPVKRAVAVAAPAFM
jgi:hypothetical protein